jgi:hypothetical protein
MEIIRSYNLYLNSRQANIGGNSNNVTFNCNPAITLSNRANRFLISIPYMEVPYSFNQLSASFNTLGYTFTDGTGTYNDTLVFPVGNYNINQWLATFLDVLNKSIVTHRPSWSLTALQATYNPATGRVTFVCTAAATTIVFKLSANYVIALMLGFPQANQTVSNTSFLTSINKVCANPVNAIFLRSDSLKFSSSYEAVVGPYQQADILARVPVPTLPNSWIYYRGEVKQMLSNTEISTINLYWSDNLDPQYILDLNGLPYGLQITIDEIQLKPTNAFQDQVGQATKIALPAPLVAERERTLKELNEMRAKLEADIEGAKRKRAEKAQALATAQIEDKNVTQG